MEDNYFTILWWFLRYIDMNQPRVLPILGSNVSLHPEPPPPHAPPILHQLICFCTITHSSILAWSIPWTEEPGRLQSVGLQRVRHDWSDLVCTYTYHMVNFINFWKCDSVKAFQHDFLIYPKCFRTIFIPLCSSLPLAAMFEEMQWGLVYMLLL